MRVKVQDRRFKEGYYVGEIVAIYSYAQLITSYGILPDGKEEWHRVYAYRDHIEVLKDEDIGSE